jgi:hypothetical protein
MLAHINNELRVRRKQTSTRTTRHMTTCADGAMPACVRQASGAVPPLRVCFSEGVPEAERPRLQARAARAVRAVCETSMCAHTHTL